MYRLTILSLPVVAILLLTILFTSDTTKAEPSMQATTTPIPTTEPCQELRTGDWGGVFTVSPDRTRLLNFRFGLLGCHRFWTVTASEVPIRDCQIEVTQWFDDYHVRITGRFDSETHIRGSTVTQGPSCLDGTFWGNSWKALIYLPVVEKETLPNTSTSNPK